MIETLISCKTRVKLLFKFFLNSKNSSFLRGLEAEFGKYANAMRLEINKLEDAGLLSAEVSGNKKFFKANTNHPFFGDIPSASLLMLGITFKENCPDVRNTKIVDVVAALAE